MKRLIAIIFFLVADILLLAPSLSAQWEPDVRLTYSDSSSMTSPNNAKFIAVCGDTVHIVWWEHRVGRPKVYYKRSTDGGTVWGPDTPLTGDSAAPFSPCLAAFGSGVHVVWQDQRDGPLNQLYYKGSTDGGATWGPDTHLSIDTNYAYCPCIAASGSEVHLFWHHATGGDSSIVKPDIFYRRSMDGGRTWEPVRRLTTDRAHSMYPTAAITGTNIHVAWVDDRRGSWLLYYKRSTDEGVTWEPDTALASAGNYPYLPSLAASGPDIHIVWNRLGLLYYLRSTDNGATWEPERCLTPLTTLWPSVVASGPNVHIAWHGHWNGTCKVTYKRSPDRGTTWGPDTSLTVDTLGIEFPTIAVSDAKVHLAWNDRRNGIWQMYYKRNPTGNSGIETAEERGQRLEVRIKATPNPFTTFAVVPGWEKETFELYDIAGKKVGTYRGDRIGANLPAGVYFLRTLGKTSTPVRIVKVR